MNDRFKFRIWDKKLKKLAKWGDNPYHNMEIMNYICVNNPVTDWKHEDYILMQCTGRKDKNGKLIYEKDIIRFYFDNDEIIAVIEWDNDECRFYLNTTDFFKDKYVTDYEIVKQEEYEVIGNIYQDSHLIEN